MVKTTVTILNKAGLHARPSSMLVKLISQYESDVFIGLENSMVNAKSIMGVMTLGAGMGTALILTAEGDDEEEVVREVKILFMNKFTAD